MLSTRVIFNVTFWEIGLLAMICEFILVIFITVRLGILEPSSDFQRQPGCTFILVIFISKSLEDINYISDF
jgi:hypothetical protein